MRVCESHRRLRICAPSVGHRDPIGGPTQEGRLRFPLSRAKRRSGITCRRRDSNPRHADYDAAGLRLWSCVCGRDGARMGQRNRLAVASGRLHRQSQCIVACLPPGRRACLRRRSLWDVLNTTLGGAAPDSRGVQQPRRAGSIRRSGDASSVRRRRTNLTAARACAARVDIRKNWFAANGASS